MGAAFLVKITILPALCCLGLYSFAALLSRPSDALQRHSAFYLSFLRVLAVVCLVYHLTTGDWLFQFKSEVSDAYIAVGGARSSWWSRQLVFDLAPESIPSHWHLTYQEHGKRLPWRPSNLRVYLRFRMNGEASTRDQRFCDS
jgi:hypothetical protein